MQRLTHHLVFLLCAVFIVISCGKYLPHFRSHYQDLNAYLHAQQRNELQNQLQPFLKVHFKNGNVAILNDPWIIDSLKGTISGNGFLYDANRSVIQSDQLVLPIGDIVILETNNNLNSITNSKTGGLVLLTVLNAAVTISCIINPKACFGSCPTFYTEENADLQYSVGEGFSNAIAPSLEYADIDALHNGKLNAHEYTLFMKNEALETHCIDDLQLMACPRRPGERIFHSPQDRFYLCDTTYAISHAMHANTEITPLLNKNDVDEWYSLADSNHLSSKEEILLQFDLNESLDSAGLQIAFRQTLMTTYFIYSAMGYMGDQVSDYFAEIETNPEIKENLKNGITAELGKIDVYLRENVASPWEYQGGFYETGPIALNHQVLPLKKTIKPGAELKLVLNKGLWRIDYVALSRLTEEITPLRIRPYEILHDGVPDPQALASLGTPGQHFASLPASTYTLRFLLPSASPDYEIFLYSKGYYLEWMRAQWLQDKNLLKLRQMLKKPEEYLRQEAKAYKEYERTMEETFWNSKITTNPLVYEN